MEPRTDQNPPPLPKALEQKLVGYQKRMWAIKMLEVGFAAAFGLIVSFLIVYGLDRVIETPVILRFVLLVVGAIGIGFFLPRQFRNWVWSHRSLDQVARQVAQRDVATGDHLLGILELTTNAEEFRRSPELCRAAIAQGEQTLASRDLAPTLPTSHHRRWAMAFGGPALLAVFLMVAEPAVSANAFVRWIAPFADVDRYTYTRIVDLPDSMVVAMQEHAFFDIELTDESRHQPEQAFLTWPGGAEEANLENGRYAMLLPQFGEETRIDVTVGDHFESFQVLPTDRPAASDLVARIDLPEYLELPDPILRDVRAGSLGVVTGSSYALEAKMIRDIADASVTRTVDGESQASEPCDIDGSMIRTSPRAITEPESLSIEWTDTLGLAGHEAFELGVRVRADDDPVVHTEGAKPDGVLLHSVALVFDVKASDDFGVRTIGLEWEGVSVLKGHEDVTRGEKVIASGEPNSQQLTAMATFHPKDLGIEPQLIQLRAWAVDALPGRERSYSQVLNVRIMSAEEHMIWMTNQLSRWYDEAVEVRDVELGLRAENVALHELNNAALNEAPNRKRLERQARAERANSMRLSGLVSNGNKMLTEAARNPEFNSNTLDDWAEMMAALDGIAQNRMPTVASLLADAATTPGKTKAKQAPEAGQVREGSKPGESKPTGENTNPLGANPTVNDVETSFNEGTETADAKDDEDPKASNRPPAPLTLATTSVNGGGPPPEPSDDSESQDDAEDEAPSMTKEELAKAIEEQNKLLEEFDKVAGKITEVLENLEGSTFVKRLKAASRLQTSVAGDLIDTVGETFGLERDDIEDESYEGTAQSVTLRETDGSRKASVIQSDLSAYVDRLVERGSDFGKYQKVLEDMKDKSPTADLSGISDDTEGGRPGSALANAEVWSDTFDRWAEQLVGPG